jgi:hypothetical protein
MNGRRARRRDLSDTGTADELSATTTVTTSTTPTDIQMLQTAASLEALAVSAYQRALALPAIGGASADTVVRDFFGSTLQHHEQHLEAFNATVTGIGGKPQRSPDPALAAVVAEAVIGLASPASVVALALAIEQVLSETYVSNTSALSDADAKKLCASVMGVEAQHAAVLLAFQAVSSADPTGIDRGTPDGLPATVTSAGFPTAFYPTDKARPAGEGATS